MADQATKDLEIVRREFFEKAEEISKRVITLVIELEKQMDRNDPDLNYLIAESESNLDDALGLLQEAMQRVRGFAMGLGVEDTQNAHS